MKSKIKVRPTDSPTRRLASMRSALREILGREKSERLWRQIEPAVRDAAGQGDRQTKGLVGDAENPQENYWNGVWQIYEAR